MQSSRTTVIARSIASFSPLSRPLGSLLVSSPALPKTWTRYGMGAPDDPFGENGDPGDAGENGEDGPVGRGDELASCGELLWMSPRRSTMALSASSAVRSTRASSPSIRSVRSSCAHTSFINIKH